MDFLRNVLRAYGPYNPSIMRTDFHTAAAVRCVPGRQRTMGFHFALRGTAYVTGGPIKEPVRLQKNDFALSKTFKRQEGVSPTHYRTAARERPGRVYLPAALPHSG